MSTNDTTSPPLNWKERIERITPRREKLEASMEKQIGTIRERLDDNWLTPNFDNYAGYITTLALVFGPEDYLPWFVKVEHLFERHLEKEAAKAEKDAWYTAINTIKFLGMAKCFGASLPVSAEGFEEKWLPLLKPYKKEMADRDPKTIAFSALANGQFDLVPTYTGGGKLPAKIEAGQTFQLNVSEFTRYLAAAAKNGAEAAVVRPAFHEFVQLFPLKLNAGTLDEIDLIFAAYAYYVHFEKLSTGSVCRELHALIQRFSTEQVLKISFQSYEDLLVISPELLITYEKGMEHSPFEPFGRTTLTIKGTGETELEARKAGMDPQRRDTHIPSYLLTELIDSLKEGDFPHGSQDTFVPGASIATIRVEQNGHSATLKLDRYAAAKLDGYSRAYDLLDSLVGQLKPYG